MTSTPLTRVGIALVVSMTSACGGDTRTAPPNPPVIRIVGGNYQVWPAGLKLPAAVGVVVESAAGDPLANVNVVWTVTSGGGIVGGEDPAGHEVVGKTISLPTDPSGLESVIWTLGPLVGQQSVTASVAGFAGSPAIFIATGTPPS